MDEPPKWLPPKFPKKFIIVWLLIGALPFTGGLWGRMTGGKPVHGYYPPHLLLTWIVWLISFWGLSNSVPRRAGTKPASVGDLILFAFAAIGVVLLILGVFIYVQCGSSTRFAP